VNCVANTGEWDQTEGGGGQPEARAQVKEPLVTYICI
jgi:hypothetical protein